MSPVSLWPVGMHRADPSLCYDSVFWRKKNLFHGSSVQYKWLSWKTNGQRTFQQTQYDRKSRVHCLAWRNCTFLECSPSKEESIIWHIFSFLPWRTQDHWTHSPVFLEFLTMTSFLLLWPPPAVPFWPGSVPRPALLLTVCAFLFPSLIHSLSLLFIHPLSNTLGFPRQNPIYSINYNCELNANATLIFKQYYVNCGWSVCLHVEISLTKLWSSLIWGRLKQVNT